MLIVYFDLQSNMRRQMKNFFKVDRLIIDKIVTQSAEYGKKQKNIGLRNIMPRHDPNTHSVWHYKSSSNALFQIFGDCEYPESCPCYLDRFLPLYFSTDGEESDDYLGNEMQMFHNFYTSDLYNIPIFKIDHKRGYAALVIGILWVSLE